MKDLISREALALDVRRNLMPNVDADGTVSVEDAERYFLSRIEKAPAVDAVEVVRCKDCVSHRNCLTEATFVIARIENPYCCGGKRRMDGEPKNGD